MPSTRFPWQRSLRGRLIATYVLAVTIATAAVAALVLITVGWDKHGLTSKGLKMQARWIEEGLRFDAAGRPVAIADAHNATWVYQGAPADLKYRVLSASGRVLLASEPNASALAVDKGRFDPHQPMFETMVGGIPFYILTVPLPRRSSGEPLYIQTARSERIDALGRRALVMPVLQVALWVEVGSLVLFALAVFLTLSRMLRTTREASEAASRIEPNNLSKRLEIRDLPAEIKPLVQAFNLALGRLERGYRVQHDFLAGAAHELKTPLALIRAQVEMQDGPEQAVLLRDVDLMARQVHQLLHLAEVSEAQNYVYAPTDLAVVADEVIDHLRRLAEPRQVALTRLGPAGEVVRDADRAAIFVLLKNLVENAIRHSPVGSAVVVTIKSGALEVRDHGAGIDDVDFPHLFTRFWRGAASRDEGAGLGLAICREIANAHGWKLDARNAQPGAVFTLNTLERIESP